MRHAFILSLACGAMFAAAAPAEADVIYIASNESESAEATGASFTGSIDYTHLGGNTGSLIVSLTNTTDPSVGGFITAFLFNVNSSDPGATAVLDSTSNSNFVGVQHTSGSPFGTYDAGAAVNGNFEGGGSPALGLGLGEVGTFQFTVTASDAGFLSAMSFLTGHNQFNFVTRFRGVGPDNRDSDKVPAQVVGVPAPGAIALLALAGLVGTRRRRGH